MKRIRLTEQQLKRLVEQAINEINGENKEAVAFLKFKGKHFTTKLNGFNSMISQMLHNNLRWDAGVEASANVEVYHRLNDNVQAYVEVEAFIDFDEQGHYRIDVEQLEGHLIGNNGEYIPHSNVLIDEDEIGKEVLSYLPSED